jgi:YD repeat-containing protein
MYGNVNIAGATMGWTYDSFGNRKTQSASIGSLPIVTSTYNSLNRVSIPVVTPYGGEGDIIDDGTYWEPGRARM